MLRLCKLFCLRFRPAMLHSTAVRYPTVSPSSGILRVQSLPLRQTLVRPSKVPTEATWLTATDNGRPPRREHNVANLGCKGLFAWGDKVWKWRYGRALGRRDTF